jgi:hypothetical protein
MAESRLADHREDDEPHAAQDGSDGVTPEGASDKPVEGSG